MSKKKKQTSAAGMYTLCITIGVIVGIGLAPVMDNFVLMVIIGALAGTIAAYLINKKTPKTGHKHHH
ncbi:MAG: hypothetical protein JKY98_00070 [Gammaproteobacteria bacterium]|nr:hypothetical protein [Gammaproteobacteria bacterium]